MAKGLLATVGYLLSPLSWWNDFLINIPLAYIFATPFGLISKKLYLPMMVFGYWATNIAGFILLHHGAKGLVFDKKDQYGRKEIIKDVLISFVYTIVVIIFVKIGWLKSPFDYLSVF